MFGNTKSMREIRRDGRLAGIFNAFAEGHPERAKTLLICLAHRDGDDSTIEKPIMAVLDHIAFRETRQKAVELASALVQELPDNRLRRNIEEKACELEDKPGTGIGQERRRTMTPDEFTAKLGYTPFEPKR